MAVAKRGRGRDEEAVEGIRSREGYNPEGIGPSALPAPATPGATRGNVGVGAFEQPSTQAALSRLENLVSSAVRKAGPVVLGSGTLGTPGQSGSAPGRTASYKAKTSGRRGRSVRG